MTLIAHLVPAGRLFDGRASLRRRILFDARITGIPDAGHVLLHNISATGLLLESADELTLGEEIEIELPQAGMRSATIVWRNEQLYGCRFAEPLSTGAISAAVLRSALGLTSAQIDPAAPEPERSGLNGETGLSLRARFWIIIGLAALSWAIVALVVWIVAGVIP